MVSRIVVRMVVAIWALVLVVLGVVNLLVGLLAGDEVKAFVPVGGALLAVGVVLGLISLWLRARANEERRRREDGGRAIAEVVEARLHTMTRIGVMLTYTVTVRFAPEGGPVETFTRTVLVAPTLHLEAGRQVEVAYDPNDPANFEPLRAVDQAG